MRLDTKHSIVDLLKSLKIDSSMGHRKVLAGLLGISNYSGTGEQNVSMIQKIIGLKSAGL